MEKTIYLLIIILSLSNVIKINIGYLSYFTSYSANYNTKENQYILILKVMYYIRLEISKYIKQFI